GNGLWAHSTLALRAKSGGSQRGRADAFLALPRAPARRAFARRRHNSRRGLGKLFLGQVLGLGSKRNMGPNRAALLHPDFARAAGRLVDRVWSRDRKSTRLNSSH